MSDGLRYLNQRLEDVHMTQDFRNRATRRQSSDRASRLRLSIDASAGRPSLTASASDDQQSNGFARPSGDVRRSTEPLPLAVEPQGQYDPAIISLARMIPGQQAPRVSLSGVWPLFKPKKNAKGYDAYPPWRVWDHDTTITRTRSNSAAPRLLSDNGARKSMSNPNAAKEAAEFMERELARAKGQDVAEPQEPAPAMVPVPLPMTRSRSASSLPLSKMGGAAAFVESPVREQVQQPLPMSMSASRQARLAHAKSLIQQLQHTHAALDALFQDEPITAEEMAALSETSRPTYEAEQAQPRLSNGAMPPPAPVFSPSLPPPEHVQNQYFPPTVSRGSIGPRGSIVERPMASRPKGKQPAEGIHAQPFNPQLVPTPEEQPATTIPAPEVSPPSAPEPRAEGILRRPSALRPKSVISLVSSLRKPSKPSRTRSDDRNSLHLGEAPAAALSTPALGDAVSPGASYAARSPSLSAQRHPSVNWPANWSDYMGPEVAQSAAQAEEMAPVLSTESQQTAESTEGTSPMAETPSVGNVGVSDLGIANSRTTRSSLDEEGMDAFLTSHRKNSEKSPIEEGEHFDWMKKEGRRISRNERELKQHKGTKFSR